jgi:hypothetical protein
MRQTLTADDVRWLLGAGADRSQIEKYLVSSGIWSTTGACEIVRFLADGPDDLLAQTKPVSDWQAERRARRRLAR